MSGYGDYTRGSINNAYHYNVQQQSFHPAGGYPSDAQAPQYYGSYPQNPQMGASHNVAPHPVPHPAPYPGRMRSPLRDPSPYPRSATPPTPKSSFKQAKKPFVKKFPAGDLQVANDKKVKVLKDKKFKLGESVDELRRRVEKLEAEVLSLKRSGKRPAAEEEEDQPEKKVAKIDYETGDKGKYIPLGLQILEYKIMDKKIFVPAIAHAMVMNIEVPLENIVIDKTPATMEALEENLGCGLRVFLYKFFAFSGRSVKYVVKKAEMMTDEFAKDYVELFRSNNMEAISVLKGNFIFDSRKWIRITRCVDGRIRMFEVPSDIITDEFGNRPMVKKASVKAEPKSELYFRVHRVLMHDEIVYFLTDAWFGKRPLTESAYELRVPNTEGTEIYPAKYNITSAKFMSATCVVDGKPMTFDIPVERVKFGLKYCKSLYDVEGSPKCYLYLRKSKDSKYQVVVALLKSGMFRRVERLVGSADKEAEKPDSSEDMGSFTVVDELGADDEDNHSVAESEASKSSRPRDVLADGARNSVIQESDDSIFQPVSSVEGYIHWKDQVFRVQPSDLWQEEVRFIDFHGLSASPAQCRIAVIEEVDSAPRYELIVASLGELPSPESIAKVVKGHPGVLKFIKDGDRETMAIDVDQKEYPIDISQLFLSGRKLNSIDEAKEYYTRKLTVLFDASGSGILMAFHPTRPDVCLKPDRCLIEVSSTKTLSSPQVHVLTGKYKGTTFSYTDEEINSVDGFQVFDCDILLSETNTFVLGDFNLLDTKPPTSNPVKQEARVALSRKFATHIRKGLKGFFDFHTDWKLPVFTSAAVVGMKVVNRLVEKLNNVVDSSLTEVLQVSFQECFPGKTAEEIREFVSHCEKDQLSAGDTAVDPAVPLVIKEEKM